MAKQMGLIRGKGTFDNINLYRHKYYGDLMRMKPGPSREKVKKSKQFENTRRHNAEFGRASHYGKLIRRAFQPMIKKCYDGTMYQRLNSRIHELLVKDPESEWGKRDLRRQSLEQFRHFELNSFHLSSRFIELPVDTTINKGCVEIAAGINIASKVQGASAWKLMSMTAAIDFRTEEYETDIQESDLFELKKGRYGVSFRHWVDENAVVFHGMGFLLYQYDALIDEYKLMEQERVNPAFIRYVE